MRYALWEASQNEYERYVYDFECLSGDWVLDLVVRLTHVFRTKTIRPALFTQFVSPELDQSSKEPWTSILERSNSGFATPKQKSKVETFNMLETSLIVRSHCYLEWILYGTSMCFWRRCC